MRLDSYLYETGKFDSRTKAARAVEEGLVLLRGRPTKAAQNVEADDEITVIARADEFVSEGGAKLCKAMRDFGLNFNDKIYADIGASTGGYTDCLLQNGARLVYAVDVGKDQLHKKIATDSRVRVMDGVNARTLKKSDFDYALDGITVDCSFISLKLLLGSLSELLDDGGEVIALIKPQFECESRKSYKNGIIKDRKIHIAVAQSIFDFALTVNLIPTDFTFAPIRERKNTEFLIRLVKGGKKMLARQQLAKLIENL